MGELVHIRLDPKMRLEIKKIVAENMFSTESEFIKESIRAKIEIYRKIRILDSLRGSLKPSKNHKKIPISEVFRAAGLED
jgi:Arc/MetJ-type ribon-helix-helix transcriptional regulator